jgi:hypothetical protein
MKERWSSSRRWATVFVAARLEGRAYDEIVLHYGGAADHHRTWRKVADHDTIADHQLADDNTSRGWATVEH